MLTYIEQYLGTCILLVCIRLFPFCFRLHKHPYTQCVARQLATPHTYLSTTMKYCIWLFIPIHIASHGMHVLLANGLCMLYNDVPAAVQEYTATCRTTNTETKYI